MSNWKQKTVETYNNSALELAAYFKGIGPRTSYIELAIEIAGRPKNPKIVEIGCGDGRDAKAIVDRTTNYLGFDISEELIKIARSHVPGADFRVADAVSFDYPQNQDLVFAFASILHLNKAELKEVLSRVYSCLKPGGVFYISSKFAEVYAEKVKEDEYGQRMFYFYNSDIIGNLGKDNFEVVTTFNEMRGRTEWFETALRKK